MKYALVTGGSKGIGKAISLILLKKGYFVILNYANDDEIANATFLELNKDYTHRVKLIKEDLSQHGNIENFCKKIKEITQHLEVLVLNVGKTDRTSFGKIDYHSFLNVFETNLFVPFFLIQEIYTIMPKGSSIVMTGSSMGNYPHSTSVAYGVSKAAVHALTVNMVKFLASNEIRINAIAPGFIDTEWQKIKSDEIRQNIEKKIALKRFGTSAEVAQATMLLIDNKYINGEILKIDGGYSID